MKSLIALAALAAVAATPALAQTKHTPTKHTRAQEQQTYPQMRSTQRHSDSPANDVYDSSGHYIGSDPDASVRDMLTLDPGTNGN